MTRHPLLFIQNSMNYFLIKAFWSSQRLLNCIYGNAKVSVDFVREDKQRTDETFTWRICKDISVQIFCVPALWSGRPGHRHECQSEHGSSTQRTRSSPFRPTCLAPQGGRPDSCERQCGQKSPSAAPHHHSIPPPRWARARGWWWWGGGRGLHRDRCSPTVNLLLHLSLLPLGKSNTATSTFTQVL